MPTIHEAGLPGYYAASWYGLLLPTGVPQSTIATLSREIVTIMRAPDIKERMLSQGFEPVGNDPEGFARFIREELPRWEKVVKTAGITAQ